MLTLADHPTVLGAAARGADPASFAVPAQAVELCGREFCASTTKHKVGCTKEQRPTIRALDEKLSDRWDVR
ncbi:MAG: hypothetical protein F2840_01255 [Actinobacteria bacterium]|nr:hypothetical protein [Actinomycetota bacterium]